MIFNTFVKLMICNYKFSFLIEKRASMHAVKELRVALIVLMNAMTSNSMDGMVLFEESFKDLNTECSTVSLSE